MPWHLLRLQVTAFLVHTNGETDDQTAADLFVGTAARLYDAGLTHQNGPLISRVLAYNERVLGPDHPDTLVIRNNLAYAYQRAGDLGRAIPLYQDTLTDFQRVLGPDHPLTLTTRGNLAGAFESAGDLSRAIPL